MISARPEAIKILISDIDGCLLDNAMDRPDLLSMHLIDIAKGNNFTAWYACTHRSYAGYKNTDFIAEWRNAIIKYNKALQTSFDPDLMYTRNVVAAFEAATELSCFGVSTPDDMVYSGTSAQKCGIAYEKVLKLYEKELMVLNAALQTENPNAGFQLHIPGGSEKLLSLKQLLEYTKNKNLQIVQIMRHVQHIYGDKQPIELYFFDDLENLCRDIKKIASFLLPPNVVIRSYQHKPADGIFADLAKPMVTLTAKGFQYEYPQRLFNKPIQQLVVQATTARVHANRPKGI